MRSTALMLMVAGVIHGPRSLCTMSCMTWCCIAGQCSLQYQLQKQASCGISRINSHKRLASHR